MASELFSESERNIRRCKLAMCVCVCVWRYQRVRDIKKILNDKWVLWTSFFNSNLLCSFFLFYPMFDYISMSHSYFEWAGNHKQNQWWRERVKRSSNSNRGSHTRKELEREEGKKALVDLIRNRTPHQFKYKAFVALTNTFGRPCTYTYCFSFLLFSVFVDFLHWQSQVKLSWFRFFFVLFFTWDNIYI